MDTIASDYYCQYSSGLTRSTRGHDVTCTGPTGPARLPCVEGNIELAGCGGASRHPTTDGYVLTADGANGAGWEPLRAAVGHRRARPCSARACRPATSSARTGTTPAPGRCPLALVT